MWTSRDYLGEAGIGAWSYTGGMPFNRPYPWVLTGASVIDILGVSDGSCKYASTVWGLEDKPVIAVRPANPCTTERYHTGSFTTCYGRAMAIVRAGAAGTVRVTASDGAFDAKAEITIM